MNEFYSNTYAQTSLMKMVHIRSLKKILILKNFVRERDRENISA